MAKTEVEEAPAVETSTFDWESEEGVKKLKNGYDEAVRYARPLWERRIKNFNTLIGKIRQKKYKSQANFHVPYSQTLLEIVFSLLVASEPRGVVQPRIDDKDRDPAQLMNELSNYTLDANDYDRLFLMAVKESMQFDTAWAKVTWDYQDEKVDRPKIDLLDTFHVLTHPRKVYIDDRWPAYHYHEMTKEEMKERGWSEAAISSLSDTKMRDDEWRRRRVQSLGYLNSLPAEDTDLYPVVEIYGMFDVGNGKSEQAYFVLGNEEKLLNCEALPNRKKFQSPYNHQWSPLVPLPYNPQPHIVYGESFIDPIASQQLELNALENMKVDNYKLRNNPPLNVNRNADVDTDTLRFETGATWLTDGPESVTMVELPDLAESIDNQQQMVRKVMQDRTGANDVLLVSDTISMKGDESATGASIANENTKLRFQPQGIQIDFFNERIVNIIVALFQQEDLFQRPIELGLVDKDTGKLVAKKINPKDVQGHIQYKVTSLSSLPDSPSMELQKALQLKQIFMQDQSISQDEINKKIIDAAGWDWNELTMDKDLKAQTDGAATAAMVDQLSGKLKQLTSTAQTPGFNPQTPQGQQILAAINQIKTQLEHLAGQPAPQPEQQPAMPPAAPQPIQQQPVAAAMPPAGPIVHG